MTNMVDRDFSNTCFSRTPNHLFDKINEKIQFKIDQNTYEISRLILSCDNYLMSNILCPWGYSLYSQKYGHIETDIFIQ